MDTYNITLCRANELYTQAQRESLLFEVTFLTEVGIGGPESTVKAASKLAELDKFIAWLAALGPLRPVRVRLEIGGVNGDWSDLTPDDLNFLRESYSRIYGNRPVPEKYAPYAPGVGVEINPRP